MGRIFYANSAHLYPPFLPPDLGVNPFDPESVVRYTTSYPPAQAPVTDPSQGTEAEQQLVIPSGGLGHSVIGRPIPPDTSRYASFRQNDHIAATGDIPFVGGEHGDIVVRGVHGWIILPASTAGLILKTRGPQDIPIWSQP